MSATVSILAARSVSIVAITEEYRASASALMSTILSLLASSFSATCCVHVSSGNGGWANGLAASAIIAHGSSSPAMRLVRRTPQAEQRWMTAHSPSRFTQIPIGSMSDRHGDRRSPGDSSR
jgi:hypothetical protein